MTALAAGLALVPIALSAGKPGSEIQADGDGHHVQPVEFDGLNMIVVPILYERFRRPAAAKGRENVLYKTLRPGGSKVLR